MRWQQIDHQQKHRLQVNDSDLSGSVYDDVAICPEQRRSCTRKERLVGKSTCRNVFERESGCTFHNVNLSGCTFDDLNMSGWRVHHVNLGLEDRRANLAGASIVNSRLDGMTIDDRGDRAMAVEGEERGMTWQNRNEQ